MVVRDERSGRIAMLEMAEVDDGFPIVTYFRLEWEAEDGLGVSLYSEGPTASVGGPSVPGTTAELQIRYGSDLVAMETSTDGRADWRVELGPDPGLPGAVIVLFRDATGAAVKGIGTRVKAGPFAAG